MNYAGFINCGNASISTFSTAGGCLIFDVHNINAYIFFRINRSDDPNIYGPDMFTNDLTRVNRFDALRDTRNNAVIENPISFVLKFIKILPFQFCH